MRLIDADELKGYKFVTTSCYLRSNYENGYSRYKQGFNDAIDSIINNAPTVEERPTGEWKLDDTEQFCYCSNCEDTYYPRPLDPSWYFCPHCGARMEDTHEQD